MYKNQISLIASVGFTILALTQSKLTGYTASGIFYQLTTNWQWLTKSYKNGFTVITSLSRSQAE